MKPIFVCVIAIAVIGVSVYAGVYAGCEPGWTEYEAKCYRLFNNPKHTWIGAQTYCSDLGGNLVTITNPEENNFIQRWWKSLRDEHYNRVYIGYNDRHCEGEWIWASGSSSTYTKWQTGEPNNGPVANANQDCATMWNTSSSGTWDDKQCHLVMPFICEKSVNDDYSWVSSGSFD